MSDRALVGEDSVPRLVRGTRLQFDKHDQRVTVVWQAGRLAGVKFQTPIGRLTAPKRRGWLWSRK